MEAIPAPTIDVHLNRTSGLDIDTSAPQIPLLFKLPVELLSDISAYLSKRERATLRTTCCLWRDLLTSTIFHNIKLTLFPTPPIDTIFSLESASFLPFIRRFHLQFYQRFWKAAKKPGLRFIWRSMRIVLLQSTYLEEFVVEMDDRKDHIPMWLQRHLAQSTSIRRIRLIESINAFPAGFWSMVSNKQCTNTWEISLSQDMDANDDGLPLPAVARITELDFVCFWNDASLEKLVKCPPPHLTALTLYVSCPTTTHLLTSLLVQCPTITTLDLGTMGPLDNLSPQALPRLRKLTIQWLTSAGLLVKGRPVEELKCIGLSGNSSGPFEERLDVLLECGSVPLRTLSIAVPFRQFVRSPLDLSLLSAVSDLTLRVTRRGKPDSFLIALNTPIRIPINLKTLVLHVEDRHFTLNLIPKAESRQALFNMITRYESTTHTLRLIAVASHPLNSAPHLRYVCSKVGEEWIVDEDERHVGSYSMCLRAGQLIQEQPLEGDFTWWWD